MPIVVERKPLTWAERTQIPQILLGMKTTLINMFGPKVTMEYPEERPILPKNYRGVPTLVKDPNGRIKCVACQLCEFVCPPKAIRIKPMEIPRESEDANVEKMPREFDIDMLRCIYCGLCEEVCPEQAIFLQNTYSLNGLTRSELVLNKDELLELGGTLPDVFMKWEKKKVAEVVGNMDH